MNVDPWIPAKDATPDEEGQFLMEDASGDVGTAFWTTVIGMGLVWIWEGGEFVEEPAFWCPIPKRLARAA